MPGAPQKPRIIVTTDITSTRAGHKEPDDCQSLVRLLSMADCYDIEGLIASSRLRHGQDVCPDHIRQVLRAYGEVRGDLAKHSRGYPTLRELLACVKGGQAVALPDIPVEASIGEDQDTDASDWIIKCLQKQDARPLWVLGWGGMADTAQALWRMRESLSPAVARKLRRKLRVCAINDQDSTCAWIREQFADVWYLLNHRACRGMYRWGEASLCTSDWVKDHITPYGALGRAYPDYNGGDIFSNTLGPVKGTKEGDTPSFLFLMGNGLNVPDRPELGGWGGRFVASDGNPRHFRDTMDDVLGPADETVRKASTVYRWRDAFQKEFAARMQWCVKGPKEACHPPKVVLSGASKRRVRRDTAVTLDLSQSRGTRGGSVCCRWYVYPPTAGVEVEFSEPGASRTKAVVTKASAGQSAYVVAEVTGAGDPGMVRYARVELVIVE